MTSFIELMLEKLLYKVYGYKSWKIVLKSQTTISFQENNKAGVIKFLGLGLLDHSHVALPLVVGSADTRTGILSRGLKLGFPLPCQQLALPLF